MGQTMVIFASYALQAFQVMGNNNPQVIDSIKLVFAVYESTHKNCGDTHKVQIHTHKLQNFYS